MDKTVEEFLSKVDNLSKFEPKNLPINVLQSFKKMDEKELFKTCVQFFILKNNIPNNNNIINMSEDEIVNGATNYAHEVLNIIKDDR